MQKWLGSANKAKRGHSTLLYGLENPLALRRFEPQRKLIEQSIIQLTFTDLIQIIKIKKITVVDHSPRQII
jgi:hypothetical protein